jgi:hypothetical protein
MSNKRLFYVVIALGLIVLGAITLRTTVSTSAITLGPHDAYDEVERARADFSTYKSADTSYDEVERIRAQFHMVGSANLPFGPELAATYGRPNDASAAPNALPFGPGLAATYGRPNDAPAAPNALPFGPGLAATYGVPAR